MCRAAAERSLPPIPGDSIRRPGCRPFSISWMASSTSAYAPSSLGRDEIWIRTAPSDGRASDAQPGGEPAVHRDRTGLVLRRAAAALLDADLPGRRAHAREAEK